MRFPWSKKPPAPAVGGAAPRNAGFTARQPSAPRPPANASPEVKVAYQRQQCAELITQFLADIDAMVVKPNQLMLASMSQEPNDQGRGMRDNIYAVFGCSNKGLLQFVHSGLGALWDGAPDKRPEIEKALTLVEALGTSMGIEFGNPGITHEHPTSADGKSSAPTIN